MSVSSLRRRGAMLLAGAAALGLAAAGPAVAAPETWKLGSAAQPGSPLVVFADDFVANVTKGAPGKLVAERQFVSSEQELINQVVRGRLQMGLLSFAGSAVVVPELATFNVPFLWVSEEEREWVMDKVGTDIARRFYAEKGLVMLGSTDIRYSGVLCKFDCREPSSLKGLKSRVSPTAASRLFWRQMGTNGVQMSLGDLFPALQQGVVEAADLSFIYYVTTPATQSNPFFIETQHLHHHGAYIVNKAAFDRMDAATQQVLRSSVTPLVATRKANVAAEEALIAKFRAGGGMFHVATEAEMVKWRALAVPAQLEVVKEIGGRSQEVFDALMKGKAEYAARPK